MNPKAGLKRREKNKMNKVEEHGKLCNYIHDLYERKNHDYGDSFAKSIAEEGLAAARIRIGDKWNRFCKLSRDADVKAEVKDESLQDTLIDMANYCLMTVVEMNAKKDDDSVVRETIYANGVPVCAREHNGSSICECGRNE